MNINKQRLPRKSVDEKLFGLLVASVQDYAIFMIDTEGFIMSWNQGAAHIKGYSEDEIIGAHISIFYTPPDIEADEPHLNLKKALAAGTYESEGWRVRKNGAIFWANVVFTPIYDENHEHIGFAKITRDNTERKVVQDHKESQQAELEKRVKLQTEKILANESRFRKLIEHSYEGISLMDQDFKVFYRSLSAEKINGWNDSDRIESDLDRVIHPEDQQLLANLIAELRENPGKPIHANFRSRHRGGQYIWLECLFTNRLGDEFINAIVCNFRDITKIKEQHLQLIEAAETQAAILNALSPHIALLDEHGMILTVNESWKKFVGNNKFKEVQYGVGQPYLAISEAALLVSAAVNREIAKGIRSVMKGRKKEFTMEYSCQILHKKRWFQLVVAPLADQKHQGVVVLHINITQRKLAEEQLINSQEKINKQNDALKDIAWISSHEVRRPVASIMGLVNLLKLSEDKDDEDELIEMVERCAMELDQLVHHIHDKITQLDS